MGKSKTQYDFDSSNLLFYIFSKIKLLIIISVIAAVGSFIAASFITPKYLSSVIMFPTSSASVSQSLLSTRYVAKGSLMSFGEEEEAEQLLQVLSSEEIKNRIINKYNLMEHYGIDVHSKYPYTKLGMEYKKNFSFHRTEYMSVIVEVMDKDPKLAAEMANDIANLVDTVMNNMQKERALKAYELVKNQRISMISQMNAFEDTLDYIRSKGVIDYEKQAEVYSKGYADALIGRNNAAAQELDNRLKTLGKFGGKYLSITTFLLYQNEQLSLLESKFAEAKLETEQNLPHKYIVDSAKVSEKKAYPKRLIIVLVSTISAFVLSIIALIILDNFRKYKEATSKL